MLRSDSFFTLENVILIWIIYPKPQIYEINISKSRTIDRHFDKKIRVNFLTKMMKKWCFRILSRIILGRFLRLENMFLNQFNLPDTTKNIDKHQNFDIPKKSQILASKWEDWVVVSLRQFDYSFYISNDSSSIFLCAL